MTCGRALVVAVVLLACARPAAADEPASLAAARALYNAADYDGAIRSASEARRDAAWRDAAALVVARSHLERYRLGMDTDALAAARGALSMVRRTALNPRDQVDLVIGLGQALYLSDHFGAAADLFGTALARGSLLGEPDRQRLLDWWASAVDQDVQSRGADQRAAPLAPLIAQMEEELALDPGNPVANYWLAVGARGSGDIEGAWNAAIAGWVRSTLSPESADALRVDLDQLVREALVPERARVLAATGVADAEQRLREEWDLVRQQWP